MPSTAVSALQKAAQGLSYVSETDAPFTAFEWAKPGPVVNKKEVVARAGKSKADPVTEISLDEFFHDLVEEQDWHGDAEKADVKKFRGMLQVIGEQVADAKVFKIGKTQVDIFIVGKTKEGNWAGLKTAAVET
jgi:Nuclease A inhibitor-like protein